MKITPTNVLKTRNFWQWLNIVWNRVDKKRIEEVGPDRACAEWLMRNGAFVKWSDDASYVTNYNSLPPEGERHLIKEVDGTDSSITDMGFPYFAGCTSIERVRFHRCTYLDDKALQNMGYLKNTLKYFEVSANGNITDVGVKSLSILSKLKSLVLFDLPGVKNVDVCKQFLQKSLPDCNMDFQEKH